MKSNLRATCQFLFGTQQYDPLKDPIDIALSECQNNILF